MIRRLGAACFCQLLAAASITAAPERGNTARKNAEKAASAGAARVVILPYEDKTGTQNFEYMPGSLQEAITNSMHEKFEFNEVAAAKINPVAARIAKKNNGNLGAKEAAQICREADIDILIFGDFVFNTQSNAIEIHTKISLGSTDKFRVLETVTNKVDSTIFHAADKVATNIVAEITKVVREQQEARGKAAETEKNNKAQLKKTEKRKTWADVNWNFALGIGAGYPLANLDNASVKIEPAVNAYGMYRLKGNWHVGLSMMLAEILSHKENGPYETQIIYLATAANAGYYFDIAARWRVTTAVGLGYYIGKFSVSSTCPAGDTQCFAPNTVPETQIRNPFAMAHAGIHFLIFSFLSVGVQTEYRMLYDAKPLHTMGGYLTLAYVF